MVLSLFSTDEVIEMCFSSVNELQAKIVDITYKITQPDTLSYFETDRQRDMDRIKIIQKIIELKKDTPPKYISLNEAKKLVDEGKQVEYRDMAGDWYSYTKHIRANQFFPPEGFLPNPNEAKESDLIKFRIKE